MSASRICLVAAIALGLNACVGRRDIPAPSPPLTNASPAPESAVPPIAPATKQPAPGAVPRSSSTTPVPKVVPPVVKTPAPITRAPQPAAPPAASLTLNLDTLTKQLKETKAIGVFSKLALKNQIEDLLDEFRKYYQGNSKMDMAELRRSYNLLLMKVLSLLQDEDQKLSSAIVSSRDAIWNLLADPKKFATLKI
jgi:hypothetical protein